MGPILFLTNQIPMPLFTNNLTGKTVDAIKVDTSQPNVEETIFQWIRSKTTSTIKIITLIDSLEFESGYVKHWDLYINGIHYSMYNGDYLFYINMILIMPNARFERAFTPVEESMITRAEDLLSRHEDGWTPNPSDWNIIREALREGRIALDRLNTKAN
jgi:hypothetical protein